MKNKILIIFMIITMCISLCACGGPTATVIDKEGNTVQMTAKQLKQIYDENYVKFDELYHGAEIELIGKVSRIQPNSVSLKGDWEVELSPSRHGEVLRNLEVGDEVYVKTNISSAFVVVNLKGTYSTGAYNDNTIKTTVFRKSYDQALYEKEYEKAYDSLSSTEKEIFDTCSKALKNNVNHNGLGEYTDCHAWNDKNGTLFYLENSSSFGCKSTWLLVKKDGTVLSAQSPEPLQKSKNPKKISMSYERFMNAVNLYTFL